MDKYLTAEGVMRTLHICRRTAINYMHQMPHVNTGGKLLVSEISLMKWIEDHTQRPAEPVKEADYTRRPRRRADLDDNILVLPNGHIPTRAQERELRRLAEEEKKRRRKQA